MGFAACANKQRLRDFAPIRVLICVALAGWGCAGGLVLGLFGVVASPPKLAPLPLWGGTASGKAGKRESGKAGDPCDLTVGADETMVVSSRRNPAGGR